MTKSRTTAEKVLDILLLFNESRRELSVDEISHLFEMPKSSTYRYVRVLCEKGFLEKSGPGNYQLGLHILELGQLSRGRQDIADIALPIMEEISEKTRETVLLTRLSGRLIVCVARVEGPQVVRISFERGQVQPLYAGASSKILLAFTDEQLWEQVLRMPLERFTEHTVTDEETLRTQLREIRRQRYCVSQNEVALGACAVAVPILNSRNQLIAGLSTTGPAFRMTDDVVARHLELLGAGVARIQKQILRG